jgi:hypothetical protein
MRTRERTTQYASLALPLTSNLVVSPSIVQIQSGLETYIDIFATQRTLGHPIRQLGGRERKQGVFCTVMSSGS